MVNLQNGVCIRDEGLNCEESTGDGVSSTVAGRLDLLRPRLMLNSAALSKLCPFLIASYQSAEGYHLECAFQGVWDM